MKKTQVCSKLKKKIVMQPQVDQGQLSDPDFIGSTHQRENVQFADKYTSLQFIKQKELY